MSRVLAETQVLNCGQNMQLWAPDPKSPARTYRDLVVRDKDIVKMVLLLTGSIEGGHVLANLTSVPNPSIAVTVTQFAGLHAGAKAHVNDFISTFDMFSFLWKQDLATEYAAFIATHPTLEVRPVAIIRGAFVR